MGNNSPIPNTELLELLEGERTIEELNYRFIYEIPPIDIRWEAINSLTSLQRYADDHHVLSKDWEEARLILEQHSRWNGDIIQGPAPILVPSAGTWETLGWVVKGLPDGTTYVISRFPLPWLNATAEQRIELEYDDSARIQA